MPKHIMLKSCKKTSNFRKWRQRTRPRTTTTTTKSFLRPLHFVTCGQNAIISKLVDFFSPIESFLYGFGSDLVCQAKEYLIMERQAKIDHYLPGLTHISRFLLFNHKKYQNRCDSINLEQKLCLWIKNISFRQNNGKNNFKKDSIIL